MGLGSFVIRRVLGIDIRIIEVCRKITNDDKLDLNILKQKHEPLDLSETITHIRISISLIIHPEIVVCTIVSQKIIWKFYQMRMKQSSHSSLFRA